MTATMTSKGQVTIPLAFRCKLKLRAGTVLDFDERADSLKASKALDRDRMRTVPEIARSELAGRGTAEWLEALRGPVELHPAQTR